MFCWLALCQSQSILCGNLSWCTWRGGCNSLSRSIHTLPGRNLKLCKKVFFWERGKKLLNIYKCNLFVCIFLWRLTMKQFSLQGWRKCKFFKNNIIARTFHLNVSCSFSQRNANEDCCLIGRSGRPTNTTSNSRFSPEYKPKLESAFGDPKTCKLSSSSSAASGPQDLSAPPPPAAAWFTSVQTSSHQPSSKHQLSQNQAGGVTNINEIALMDEDTPHTKACKMDW